MTTDQQAVTQIFSELRKIDGRLYSLEARLEERCGPRGKRLDAVEERLDWLEQKEHQRKGAKFILMVMLGAASAVGGLVVKYFGGN